MTVVFLHGAAGSRATYSWLPSELAGHEVVRIAGAGHSIHDERAHRDEYVSHVATFDLARTSTLIERT
jgi:pimeloyl-ACP methyl ester carboxylesterase